MGDLFHGNFLGYYQRKVFAVMSAAANRIGHTFLVLTKRPENLKRFIHEQPLRSPRPGIWFGVSAENQERLDERMAVMRKIKSSRFVSLEPLLGPVSIAQHLDALDWVIVGPERGPAPRPMDWEWVADIEAQCAAAGVPLFVKTPPNEPVGFWAQEIPKFADRLEGITLDNRHDSEKRRNEPC
jgi:protein gp37